MSDSHDLELSGSQFRELAELALDRIVPHIDSLAEQPAWNLDNADSIARSISQELPTTATSVNEILDSLFDDYIPLSLNSAGPGYLGYVPGGGLPHAAVADLISNVVNRYVGVWVAAPALAQLEAIVVRWFCEIVGFPQCSGGFLTSGGSLANWSAIVAARHCKLPEDFLKGTIYTSNQTHHSIQKAAMMAGFPRGNLRSIETDGEYRIQIDALRRQVKQDRESGLTPFAVVGHAGTTNTGAVDDLEGLADFADEEDLWFHIDAAYGGFFMLTDRGAQQMKGISRADSVTLDPHKGLFLPYGTGCLLARNVDHLRNAYHVTADYMPDGQGSSEFVDFCEISPELSRDFRGLRAWLPIRMHGIDVFRETLDEKLDLANWAADALRRMNDDITDEIEIVAKPQLSTVVFRLRRVGLSIDESNQLNERLRDEINAGKRVFLTPTKLDNEYAIRICVLSFRTHQSNLVECINEIRRAVDRLARNNSH